MRPTDVPSSAHIRHVQHHSTDGDQGLRYDAVLMDAAQDIRKR